MANDTNRLIDMLYERIKHAIARSCFQSGVAPDATARIVTLSTCSYDFSDARFVLHGILVE